MIREHISQAPSVLRSPVEYMTFSGENIRDIIPQVIEDNRGRAFYLLNEGALAEQVQFIKDEFLPGDERAVLSYAAKVNQDKRALEIMLEAGIDGVDVASPGEIEATSKLGVRPDQTYYSHPIRARDEVAFALKKGVRYFVVQNQSAVDKLLDCYNQSVPDGNINDLEIAVRASTPSTGAVIELSSGKFGASYDKTVALLNRIKSLGVKPGLAMHTGSQNTNPDSFRISIERLADIASNIDGGLSSLNLGGGLPVDHGIENTEHCPNSDDSSVYDLRKYFKVIQTTITNREADLFEHFENQKIILELGRTLVAEAFDLLIPVTEVEDDKCGIFIRGGIYSEFIDHVLYNWRFPFNVLPGDGRHMSEERRRMEIYGRSCDSLDKFNEPSLIPADIQEGDYLHFPKIGAYSSAMATNFHIFPLADTVSYNKVR